MNLQLNSLIPVSEIVRNAALDAHEDYTKVKAYYSNLAVRGLRQLTTETLRTSVSRHIIQVDKKTWTVPLPCSTKEVLFVGIVDDGYKRPLVNHVNLLPGDIEKIMCSSPCEQCNQPTDICENLSIEVSRKIIVVNGLSKEEVVTRYLENGNYYEITNSWVYDLQTTTVVPFTTKKFIEQFDMLSCNCIANTEDNIEKVKTCCPSCYDACYAPCGCSEKDYGGYNVFLENGYIQVSRNFEYDEVLVIISTDIPKIKGEFYLPAVAKEALICWVIWMAKKGNMSVPRGTIKTFEADYEKQRGNLAVILSRVSLSKILYMLDNR